MGKRDERVTAYIKKQREFARPILAHLREMIHAGCPDVVENIKWSAPAFDHKGPLVGIAGFKEHVVLGFWKHDLVVKGPRVGMSSIGRIESMNDLPSKFSLVALVKKAAALNEKGVKAPIRSKTPKKPIPMHPALRAALAKNAKAKATFDAFSPSHKREYLEWITEAKGEDTRARRVAQAIEWIAAGKGRNWKYQ
jgi:uncharacterized protein YdeI (YjbR/CyaY-like superfamily)